MFLEKLNLFEEKLVKFLNFLWVICFITFSVMILIQVLSREISFLYFKATEEIVTLTFVWMVFGRSATLFRDGEQLVVSLLEQNIIKSNKTRKFYRIVLNFLVLTTFVPCAYFAYQMLITNNSTSAMMDIDLRYWIAAILFCMVFSSLFILKNLITLIISSPDVGGKIKLEKLMEASV